MRVKLTNFGVLRPWDDSLIWDDGFITVLDDVPVENIICTE